MTAPSILALILGRVLQAVGACTCLVGARGMVRDLYTPIEGARLLAGAATFMSLAPLIGPLIGARLVRSVRLALVVRGPRRVRVASSWWRALRR